MENPVDTSGGLSVGRTWERCGGSAVGEVRKDVVEGQTSVESREDHFRHELRLGGILYPTIMIPIMNQCHLNVLFFFMTGIATLWKRLPH